MADIGYRVTRDSGGEHSRIETITRSWNRDDAREAMRNAAEKEVRQLEKNGEPVLMIAGDDLVEVRDGVEHMLIAYYETQEFECC